MTETRLGRTASSLACEDPTEHNIETCTMRSAAREAVHYDPIACELVLLLGAHGAGPTETAFELRIARSPIFNWIALHSNFLDAIARAGVISRTPGKDRPNRDFLCGELNAITYRFAMRNRFPAMYNR